MSKKDKLAVYLTPEKKTELERRYHEDGSRSMTAFIEHALDFWTTSAPRTRGCSSLQPSVPVSTDGWAPWKTVWRR